MFNLIAIASFHGRLQEGQNGHLTPWKLGLRTSKAFCERLLQET